MNAKSKVFNYHKLACSYCCPHDPKCTCMQLTFFRKAVLYGYGFTLPSDPCHPWPNWDRKKSSAMKSFFVKRVRDLIQFLKYFSLFFTADPFHFSLHFIDLNVRLQHHCDWKPFSHLVVLAFTSKRWFENLRIPCQKEGMRWDEKPTKESSLNAVILFSRIFPMRQNMFETMLMHRSFVWRSDLTISLSIWKSLASCVAAASNLRSHLASKYFEFNPHHRWKSVEHQIKIFNGQHGSLEMTHVSSLCQEALNSVPPSFCRLRDILQQLHGFQLSLQAMHPPLNL